MQAGGPTGKVTERCDTSIVWNDRMECTVHEVLMVAGEGTTLEMHVT